ncbi:hypothetical protein CHGG_09878 [Chaetomium globosum CBS 148.51]|uniref:C2H2-type domain-containing protein n=1 Tax=Chaetomium globosum (strain ATCC 6205 / CBS 148.51 / DSM 1962 / NBRC 6347 / NRRL 1970) TaxID=306901 RepID=Q2GQ76_CHAGB|nr:uncharacterized protein CHGG_09878 [Chaetomium globosum CBS 148.51]EAQ83474.1 hypothetical protein CHGG_09878 [Chaetomium globosum CBS 148.51]
MATRYPASGDHARPSTNDTATTARQAENPINVDTESLGPLMSGTGQVALSGLAKETIAGTPREEFPPGGGTVRESWVSYASTAASRDSVVPSLFSVRASTVSAATRYSVRQSSIESPISATSPTYQEHRKGSYPRDRYFCTFCDADFSSKTEWKAHEFEFHNRRERYLCRSCPAVFSEAVRFADHLRTNHGIESIEAPPEPTEYRPTRSAWGCGFCGAAISSRNEYLEHVGEHYDEGKQKSEWLHTFVIEGLLQQPQVASAWMALVAREEQSRGAKLRFLWDSDTTGRATNEREPHGLQDMLELFPAGGQKADEVVKVAYNSAQIRLNTNISDDLISKLGVGSSEATSSNLAQRPFQSPLDLHPTEQEVTDDVVSPISPLPAPLRPPTAPPRLSHPLPPWLESKSRPSETISTTSSSGPPTLSLPLRPSSKALRRIESSRSLGPTKQIEDVRALGRPAVNANTLPLLGPSEAPLISIRRARESRPRLSVTPEESSSTIDQRRVLSTPLSVKPHTSSSTLSTHTKDDSLGFGDSTSETVSDDSLSEPDSWLESGGIPTATKVWRQSFQRTVDRGMTRLWVRYSHDWDALVRQYVGDTSGDSGQYRESSGRVRKCASSRYATSNNLRPNARSFAQDEEEDGDEGEGYPAPSQMSKRNSGSAKRFACPFRKHDPFTYNVQDHEVCAIRSWSAISRLKEHIYRRHYKIHCQRCKRTFSETRELADHEMLVTGCEVVDTIPPGDITAYQEKQLKSRKHTTRRQTDEEKWRDIYRLLFPNEEIPSPYPEAAEDMGPKTAESSVSFNFQHFLLSEMPTLFTRTAEEHAGRHLQAHDELALGAIPRIIEDALHKAFRAWEARGSELPAGEASVALMSFLPETPGSSAYNFGQSTAYQTPQSAVTTDHNFSQSQFSNPNFSVEAPHGHIANPDDSGFVDDTFFAPEPLLDFNNFVPQYERGAWEPGLGIMGGGAFGADLNPGDHFRGFHGG